METVTKQFLDAARKVGRPARTTGEDVMEGFQLLKPGPGLCEACAIKHDPDQPHNKDSIHYQYWFRAREGRWPVWKDAIAHCDADTRAAWEEALREAGHWKEPGPPEVCPTPDHSIGTVTKTKRPAP
jgi:hypothetical protein